MKNLTVEIICNDLAGALSLQSSIVATAQFSGASIESTKIDSDVPIAVNWDGLDDYSDAEEEAPENDPHHVTTSDLSDIELPSDTRSSEAPAGSQKPLTADRDVVDACFAVCSTQLSKVAALARVSEGQLDDKLINANKQFGLEPLAVLLSVSNIDYYRAVTKGLHQVELMWNKANGINPVTKCAINDSLKAEYPKIAALLNM